MADLTKTVSTRVGVFAGSLTNKWNVYNWNAFTWGEGSPQDLVVHVQKLIANTITSSSAVIKSINHLISESTSNTSAVYASFSKLISNSITSAFETSNETLSQGGWNYNFPSDTTNAEGRDTVTWTSGTVGSVTWTSGTAGSTTWS